MTADTAPTEPEWSWPDPIRYEAEIQKFEADDAASRYKANSIVATGSSSMRGWHRSIQDDLAPLSIIPRGFGGSNMNDVLYFADRLITKHNPRAVMLYEGDNDVARGIPAEEILTKYEALQEIIHANNPETRIYILAVKPSPSRWDKWPQMQETNKLFQEAADNDERITYIDIATPMLGPDGQPLPDIYLKDQLHMNRKGYDIWTKAVGEVLIPAEQSYE